MEDRNPNEEEMIQRGSEALPMWDGPPDWMTREHERGEARLMRGFAGGWSFRVAEDAIEFSLEPAPVEVAVAFAETQIADWLTWKAQFAGVTSRGSRVCVYFRHVEFLTGTDDAGEEWRSPSRTEHRCTLDGAPLELEAFTQYGFKAATIGLRTDRGLIVAAADDNGELDAFPATRTRISEQRPIGGWWYTEPESSSAAGDHWDFSIRVFNDYVVERFEVRLPRHLADDWMKEQPARSIQEMAADYVANSVRSLKWAQIVERAKQPLELMWTAFPPDRRREEHQTLLR